MSEHWRSLDELADTPAFRAFVAAEFPSQAEALAGVDRRHVLKLMAASFALAGLGACTRQPEERIVASVKQPEHRVPGRARYYATALLRAGHAMGVLAESHEGRPTKIEGNPDHPATLGASDAVLQASVLGLYDPDRSKVITEVGAIRPWSALASALAGVRTAQLERRGRGLRILTGTVTSPSLARQLDALLAEFPDARWHQWEPLGAEAAHAAAVLAYGQPLATRYRFERARVVLALDADVVGMGPAHVRYARDLTRARRARETGSCRLYVAEPLPTQTGAIADHRLPVRAGDVEALARAVARRIGVPVPDADDAVVARHRAWVDAVANDLRAQGPGAAIVTGDHQPPAVHVLVHAMHEALGAVGNTVEHSDPVVAAPVDQGVSLATLVDDMRDGRVEVLLIAAENPVFTAPPDLDFAGAADRVPLRIHLGLYDDETAAICHWHVPEAHPLERWDDARAFDGTVTIVQPLIEPLYQGRTLHELLAVLAGAPDPQAYEIVREHWRTTLGSFDFERRWRRALHDGVLPGTAAPARRVAFRQSAVAGLGPAAAPPDDALELALRPDPYLLDGRFANNGWLQELPRPITKITWDNAALMSPATAARLGLENEQVIALGAGERQVEAPVWIVPGMAPGTIVLHLGYGRRRAGGVGTGIGVDAQALRTTTAPWGVVGATVRATARRHAIATTQHHHAIEGRDLVRRTTLADAEKHGASVHGGADHGGGGAHGAPGEPPSLYPEYPYEGRAWGMVIDLATCIGCNACVAACTAENNVPVVGKDQVLRGREMHWLRVDRYWAGDPDDPELFHQPLPCMHCEKAPCEVVCPVNATVHSSEGLNEMVYNRCVGTRYCSNNCPYKVRRFNFHLYADWETETLKLGRNPDVTVRSRGVMEKCTYCVQRIEESRIRAAVEGRPLRDGNVMTACQQACPTDVIHFGDLNDPQSRVARLRKDARHYALLAELGTQPRTTYLADVRNPHPDLAAKRRG